MIVTDSNNNRLRRIELSTGTSATFSGASSGAGFADGSSTAVQINQIGGLFMDSIGDMYFADSFNHRIRKLLRSNATVFTVSGDGVGQSTDVPPRFYFPSGVALDSASNTMYICDKKNQRIRALNMNTGAVSVRLTRIYRQFILHYCSLLLVKLFMGALMMLDTWQNSTILQQLPILQFKIQFMLQVTTSTLLTM